MEKTHQLAGIAANLDDISLDFDEIKDKMSEQGGTSAKALEKLANIEDGVTRAADALMTRWSREETATFDPEVSNASHVG